MHPKLPLLLSAATVVAALTAGCALTPPNIASNLEVDRLCAKDGGVHIYEKVYLPADRFSPKGKGSAGYGVLKFDGRLYEGMLGPEFRYETEYKNLPSSGGSIQQSTNRVLRVADGKLLGETINYTYSFGGEVTMPFHQTHRCKVFEVGPGPEIRLLREQFAPIGYTQ
jgi:hypothetical protein